MNPVGDKSEIYADGFFEVTVIVNQIVLELLLNVHLAALEHTVDHVVVELTHQNGLLNALAAFISEHFDREQAILGPLYFAAAAAITAVVLDLHFYANMHELKTDIVQEEIDRPERGQTESLEAFGPDAVAELLLVHRKTTKILDALVMQRHQVRVEVPFAGLGAALALVDLQSLECE